MSFVRFNLVSERVSHVKRLKDLDVACELQNGLMGAAKKRCCCRLCNNTRNPIDTRAIKRHIALYGHSLKYHERESDSNVLSETQGQDDAVHVAADGIVFSSPNDKATDKRSLHRLDDETFEYEGDESDGSANYSVDDEEEELLEDSELEDTEDEQENEENTKNHWSSGYDLSVYDSDVAINKLPNSDLTLIQWLCYQFYMLVSHPSMSKSAFSHNLKIQKITQKSLQDQLPSSYKEARRMIDPFLVKKKVFSVCPRDCVIFRTNENYSYSELTKCPICNEDRYFTSSSNSKHKPFSKRRFIYVPVGPRLSRTFGDVNLAQLVQGHSGANLSEKGEMWDIQDSPAWKDVYSDYGYFEGDRNGLSFSLELDGVNPFHNVGVMYSMTPMMLTLLNLPRHIRNCFGNIKLVGIIPGNGKTEASNLEPYIEVLVDELIFLSGCKMYSAYNKAPVDVKCKLLIFVLDYPGLSKVFRIHGSGSLMGCHWCTIRGYKCSHLDKVVYPSNRCYLTKNDVLRSNCTHFVKKKKDESSKPNPRNFLTELNYREAFEQTKNKARAACVATATGCKNNYVFSKLQGHDRVNECFPDACHTIKDVVQNVMNVVTGNKVNMAKIVTAEKKMNRFHLLSRSSTNYDEENITFNSSDSEGETSEMEVTSTDKRTRPAKKCVKKRKHHNTKTTGDLPFQLTRAEINIADERAKSIRVPACFGLKPSAFISKTGSLKSHDWKQLATNGILKFCLRGLLEKECRETLFLLLDCLAEMCHESINTNDIDILEQKLNKSLVMLEMYFPLHLQNITTHLLRHIPDGLRRFGPVYGTWMFTYERFNSWICKRVLNMRYPEATAIETFLLHDWCHYMVNSRRVSLNSIEVDVNNMLEDESQNTSDVAKLVVLKKREINLIHRACNTTLCSCDNFFKYYNHKETHPITRREVSYSSEVRERSTALTISSFICCERNRGPPEQKVESGKFVEFGRILYFIEHKGMSDACTSESLAYVRWMEDVHFDSETKLWFGQKNVSAKPRCSYVLTNHISKPLVTVIEAEKLWILNSDKKQFKHI